MVSVEKKENMKLPEFKKLFSITYGFIMVIFIVALIAPSISFAKEKEIELNTRGACLTVDDFKALIKHEVKGMKSGQTLRLIIDTPNEKEASDAIKQEGHIVIETTRNKDKDSTTYLIRVNK